MPDLEPQADARYAQARDNLTRPGFQFNLRTLFFATTFFALIAVLARATGGATTAVIMAWMLALLIVLVGIFAIARLTQRSDVLIGGVVMLGFIGAMGLGAATFEVGYDNYERILHDKPAPAAELAWRTLRPEDFFAPLGAWLVLFGLFSVAGMVIAPLISRILVKKSSRGGNKIG